jgi:hypothetical protein
MTLFERAHITKFVSIVHFKKSVVFDKKNCCVKKLMCTSFLKREAQKSEGILHIPPFESLKYLGSYVCHLLISTPCFWLMP